MGEQIVEIKKLVSTADQFPNVKADTKNIRKCTSIPSTFMYGVMFMRKCEITMVNRWQDRSEWVSICRLL
jgi:hypothetical protein